MTTWTEDELDSALIGLLAADPPKSDASQRIWNSIQDEIDAIATRRMSPVMVQRSPSEDAPPSGARRRKGRRGLAIGFLAAAAVTTFAVPSLLPGTANSAAALALDQAAATTAAVGDPATPPGSYRYVRAQGRYLAMGMSDQSEHQSDGDVTGAEQRSYSSIRWSYQLSEWWIPADPTDVWMLSSTQSESAPLVAGVLAAPNAGTVSREVTTGRCGMVTAGPESFSFCTGSGNWAAPTQPWLSGLPKDAEGLVDRLRADATLFDGDPEAEMMRLATSALGSGRLPMNIRALLYRAMAQIPGVMIVDDAVTLDGRTGTAFALTSGADIQQQTIIDVSTGEYIGERQVALRDNETFHLVAGQTFGWSSFRIGVATTMGVAPEQ